MVTRLTSLLGIRHPVVCAPMGPWRERELAVAVSNGGGLGTFGAAGRKLGLTERHVRDTIAAIRDRTDAPFGAGFITQSIAEHPANVDVVLEAGVPVVRERDPSVTALLYGEGAGALQAVRPAAQIIEAIVADATDRLRRLGSSSAPTAVTSPRSAAVASSR